MATSTGTAEIEVKRGVRIVKKKKVEEKKVQTKTENHNGDANAELTVTLPTKKPGTKTQTEVEILRKILPDGNVEEVKTTTTKTTTDGKTDVAVKTDTRILSKDEAHAAIKAANEKQEVSEQNGEHDTDNEVVETTPHKKTGTRVETKVATQNKILDDGTVEETKTTTTTTTTSDGKVDVDTKVEKRILSKEEADAVIEVVEEEHEEEEEEEEEEEVEESETSKDMNATTRKSSIIKTEERSETTTRETKKVTIVENSKDDNEDEEEEEEEEEYEEEEETTDKNKVNIKSIQETQKKEIEEEDLDEREENKLEIIEVKPTEVEEEHIDVEKEEVKEVGVSEEEEEEEEEEEVEEEEEEETIVKKEETSSETASKHVDVEQKDTREKIVENNEEEITEEETVKEEKREVLHKNIGKNESEQVNESKLTAQEILKEPNIPLDKVEDVEIKPIRPGETVTRSQTQNTEIITSQGAPSTPLSTQTEFNRYENITTMNRTTRTLDKNYEQMFQSSPPQKTYFPPPRDAISPIRQPTQSYQPTSFNTAPEQERRHSLLLDRISIERQMPEAVQTSYQNFEQQNQFSQEPQSEVLTVSNVKPSSITKNQQWYQYSTKENTITSSAVPTTPTTPSQQWNQPQYQPPPQPQYQAPTQQPLYQAPAQQPQYQQPASQPLYQSAAPQPQYQTPTPSQYQSNYSENVSKDYSRSKTTSNSYQQDSYSNYTSKPTWGTGTYSSTEPVAPSYLNKDVTDSYKESQQYSSSYVPPPWEQNSNYAVGSNTTYYETKPASTFSSTPAASWQPAPPKNKFSKPTPTAYIPPAPNQSFVKSVSSSESIVLPGRKTYYSEYEKRYISVPESSYVPGETKYQPQPDPSPKFYYDNNEQNEPVEPQWRKELREFTEKTTQTQRQTSEQPTRPPWEEQQPSYHKQMSLDNYTPTPTWSQTLKPSSWRERSFESEYVSQEWPKTSNATGTIGRGRPLSYVHTKTETTTHRSRGVSVDRYNPNSYLSPTPAEHPPVQSVTLTPANAPHKPHPAHNPNVPAYHNRSSAEPGERVTSYQQPRWGNSRSSPIQSRSFKYLQWITGTDE